MRRLLICALLASAAGAAPPTSSASPQQSGTAGDPTRPPRVPTEPGLPAGPRTATNATSTYKVSPGDQLDIYVWGDERLQRTLTVLPDGTFAFPLAGTVQAAGHTPNEIEAELSRLLASQYKGQPPQVTASIRQSSGLQVSVIGKVKAPGSFSPTRYLTVLDALAMAGGPTDFADVGNIVILRNVGGRISVVHARLSGVLKGRPGGDDLSASAIPLLMAGDTVVVP